MKLHCFTCKKPVTDEFPDNMIIFRGTAECPECAMNTPEKEKDASQSMVIKTQNAFTEFIAKAQREEGLSRRQIRFLLTEKLNDMSKTDMWWD